MQEHTRYALFGMLAAFGIHAKADRLRFARACGIDVSSYTRLSESEAQFLCDVLQELGPPH